MFAEATKLQMILLNSIKLITLTSCVDVGLVKDEMDNSDSGEIIKSTSKVKKLYQQNQNE